jgi:tRNA threonylcarbamoyladenosine biosynthesis protein TsaE
VIELRSPSAHATHSIAEAVAGLARAGDLVVLAGDLGAGKTWFAKGFARGLGVTDTVTSPTFTLLHSYEGGRLPLHHGDAYRLDRLSETADLALAELLETGGGGRGGVVLLEWGDIVSPALGGDYLEVRLEPDDEEPETARRVSVRSVGRGWAMRFEQLEAALAPWRPC